MRMKIGFVLRLCRNTLFLRIGGTFLSRIVGAGLENPAYPKGYNGIMTQSDCSGAIYRTQKRISQ